MLNERNVIKGGYILLSRKLIESEIWYKPPMYLKVWVYLLSKAQHKDYKNLKRGQLFTTIDEIRNECSYTVGWRKEIPSKKQIYSILAWLKSPYGKNLRYPYARNDEADKNDSMIVTTKGTHGILITILNFNDYQDPKNYEGNYAGNKKKRAKGTAQGEVREQYKQECKECKECSYYYSRAYIDVADLYNEYFECHPLDKEIEELTPHILCWYENNPQEEAFEVLKEAFAAAVKAGAMNLNYLIGFFRILQKKKIKTTDEFWEYQAKYDTEKMGG